MQGTLFQICLAIGLIASALYFVVGSTESQYKTIHKVVFGVILLTFFTEAVWFIALARKWDTFWLYNLLFVHLRVSTMLLLYYFLPFSCQIQGKIQIALWIFLGSGIINSLFFQPIQVMVQSYSQVFGNFVILFFSLIFFKDIIRQSKFSEANLISIPYFWIATFSLFSFGESMIFHLLSSLFLPEQLYSLGFIQMFVQFFTGLMFIVFGMAFYIPEYLAPEDGIKQSRSRLKAMPFRKRPTD